MQQSNSVWPRRSQLEGALEYFTPSRFKVKKTICDRCVSALGRAIDQTLRHPREAAQPCVGLFGFEELANDLPTLGLINTGSGQSRGDVICQ
ncbi:hypothetical protein, partial [Escherichia coli]|uniref:hypothetical protein n=1 Tax=Escherichia coli TaxID=562 RepID=UPI001BC8A7DF